VAAGGLAGPHPTPPAPANLTVGVCALCGYRNNPSDAFCQNCGAQLVPSTTPLQSQLKAAPEFGKLMVRDSNAMIDLPAGKSEMILGRSDPVRNIFPDVDLTPYGGEKSGVSRRHARLMVQDAQVYIEDLNSTNFTFLNQQKLKPGQLYLVVPGDEIRVGLLVMDYRAD
jgi:pSer/pThr/pTyr-binding forkhead associated (FHA) protein